jgi:hypothetical protein
MGMTSNTGHGGESSLDNLVLLCGLHHRVIHHGHWTVAMENGRPVFGHELGAAAAGDAPYPTMLA